MSDNAEVNLLQKIDSLEESMKARFVEYSRRLDELQEAHNRSLKEAETWKFSVVNELAMNRGKNIAWASALVIIAAIVQYLIANHGGK